MGKLVYVLAVALAGVGGSAGAATFTQGDLTYDDLTGIISGNGKEYLGLDVGASWTYAQALAATSIGGAYESFSIANTADADQLIGATFGSNPDICSTSNSYSALNCGSTSGWFDGKFGDNGGQTTNDYFFFLANPDRLNDVGLVTLEYDGTVLQNESWGSIPVADEDSARWLNSPWLMVRDVAIVPLPSSLPLMLAGLAVFGWVGRRRKL